MHGSEDSERFLKGGGEMGTLIRAFDWDGSPLGPPATWPQGLKTAVRLLLSTGHPMLLWWGPDLIQFYNDAYSRSIGPERHPSALGQNGRECWGEIWSIIGPQIAQVMEGEGHTWHENQLVPITRHGHREDVYWTYSYSPVDDPQVSSGIGGVLVVCSETTEQVLAEQRTKAAEARWRALFEQAPGFMCILSGPDHVFEFANPAYDKLVGQRELIGKTVGEAIPEAVSQGFIALLDEVYRTGRAHRGTSSLLAFEKPGTAGRQEVYLDFVYQPILDVSGAVTGIFVDGYDVTERVHANEDLRAQDRRKDEFLAMLAHELRNPLAPIRNASELLTATATRPEIRSIGALLGRQVTQLTRLIDDLMDVSRITRGLVTLQRETISLGVAVDLAIESLRVQADRKRHELVLTPSERVLYVDGDLTRIIQCVSNVLANAIKYTDAGGRIGITIRADNDAGVIEISDNGVGISPDELPHVFDLFLQADRTLDRSQGGLGIGLSVVQRLVEMHGGQVTGESAGLGHGATFRIVLPLVETPPTPAERPFAELLAARRVLVVDDNADAADSFVGLLEVKGHVAVAVYGAQAALQAAHTFAPDIVFLDIGLPDMDGYEVARRLRAERESVVLVALTGYGRAEDVRQAQEAGFNAHLTKPVALADLERVLRGS